MTKKELTRIAIIGGPGTGKSTVLDILAKRGYQIVPEAGRIIIKEVQAKNQDSPAKRASYAFQNKISKLQFKLENNFKEGIVFSDRGIVDGYVYSKLNRLKVPNIITKHGKNRYRSVFILDSLPVYKNDQVRLRDEKTAKKIHSDLRKAYIHFGYTPISVPVLSPNERVEFILAKLKGENKKFLAKVEKELLNLPGIKVMKDVWQNNFHEFDVYTHTLEYVRYIKEMTDDPNLIVAGYLHDIGKPVTAKLKYKDGKLQERAPGKMYHTFFDHEKIGEAMVRKMNSTFFKKYNLDQKRISKLVGAHFVPMLGIKAIRETETLEEFKQKYRELVKTLQKTKIPIEELLLMFLADKLAQGKYCTDQKELFMLRDIILTGKPSLETLYALQKKMYGNKE